MNLAVTSDFLPLRPMDLSPKAKDFTNRFNSLGIPVDNVTLESAVQRIFGLIEDFQIDRRPRLVATLNVDFLVNSLGYRFSQPKNPELISILRSADLVTADGFPIVMLSKIAGYPLKERVTGADLTPRLAQEAAKRGKSVYLLGGAGDSALRAADLLHEKCPGLEIAGVASPMVATSGENIASWVDDDEAVINDINQSGASILFMAFGNPKQELWFNRNKHRLQVPVSIGIGGTFSFITGDVKRAPVWMQNNNLEWIYRITQDPKRLLKRYLVGIVKFGMLTLPLITQRLQNILLSSRGEAKDEVEGNQLPWVLHWSSKNDVLKTLRLPPVVTRSFLEQLVLDLSAPKFGKGVQPTVLLDFSRVKRISIAANEAFCELSRLLMAPNSNGLMVGMKNSVRRRLKSSRIMDLALGAEISESEMSSSLINRNASGSDMCLKSYAVSEASLNCLSGTVSGFELDRIGFEECTKQLLQVRNVVVDLRKVRSIDSAAIAVLFRLTRHSEVRKNSGSFYLSGLSQEHLQMIKVCELGGRFNLLDETEFYDRLFV